MLFFSLKNESTQNHKEKVVSTLCTSHSKMQQLSIHIQNTIFYKMGQ